MNNWHLAIISAVWTASMFVVDIRQESRDLKTREYFSAQMDSLETSLDASYAEEVAQYENLWTLQEVIDMVNESHATDIADLKKYLIQQDNKNSKILLDWVKKREELYDTVWFEDDESVKFMLLGADILGKYYLLKQEKVDAFPFEKEIK